MLVKSVFQLPFFKMSKIHAGGLLLERDGFAESTNLAGKWSLPIYGPNETEAPTTSRADTIYRSIVERLQDDGLIRVRQTCTVFGLLSSRFAMK